MANLSLSKWLYVWGHTDNAMVIAMVVGICAIIRWHMQLRGINSVWPSDAIWRHRSGLTLAQVMACCLTALSHYLSQCWLITSKVHWQSFEGNFKKIPQPPFTKISLEMTYLKLNWNIPGANEFMKTRVLLNSHIILIHQVPCMYSVLRSLYEVRLKSYLPKCYFVKWNWFPFA